MKTLLAFVTCLALSVTMFAQETKSETIKVPGMCGMCKKKIEKAAKEGGATAASWDKETKLLTISFNSSSSNKAMIEKKIADEGYDTPDIKTTSAAYNKLDECCKYEREVTVTPVLAGLRAEVLKTAVRNNAATNPKPKENCDAGKACCKGEEKSCCQGETKPVASKPVQQ